LAEALFGGSETYSGETVTELNSLKVSAIWACNRAITNPVFSMSVRVFQKTDKGREERPDHYLNKIFRTLNGYTTWTVGLDRFLTAYNLWGNGIWVKQYSKRNGDVDRLVPIHPSYLVGVAVSEDETQAFYKFNKDGAEISIPSEEIIHLPNLGDEIVGKSPIQNAREDIGLEFSTQKYGNKFFADGGKPQGLLSFEGVLNAEQLRDARESWKKHKSSGGDAVLGGGMKYTPITIPPDDSQFIETRGFNVKAIARWFGVPPWKLADLSEGSTFSNIEHMGIAFLQDTLAPIVAKLENELNTKLFRQTEIDEGFYCEFDMESYLRADAMAQAEMDRTSIQNGLKTINEIRKRKNMNPMDGGDRLLIQSNMTYIDLLDKIYDKEDGNGK